MSAPNNPSDSAGATPNPRAGPNPTGPQIQQPTPQALPARAGPAAILVSPRQKGNPILTAIKSVPWEYSDIPADYVVGRTACALFLSLRYHRLHPEYVYGRVRALGPHRYALRALLVLVDVDGHEAPLRELAKTALVNGLTLVLAWSAPEAGRYLELFKVYEHAGSGAAGLRGAAALPRSFGERVVDFVTAPRSINKTDALGLVSNFGSVRTAVNARPEEVALVAGWGEKKVQRWHGAVREPFRSQQAGKRVSAKGKRKETETGQGGEAAADGDDELGWQPGMDEEEAMREAMRQSLEMAEAREKTKGKGKGKEKETEDKGIRSESSSNPPAKRPAPKDDDLSEGVMAALAKLRNQ